MLTKKKSILLLVKSSSGELDWILPVLFKLSKQYNIYTYFRSSSAYNSLKTNNELFSIWKKISKNYFIDNFYNNFFWKIIRKLLIYFFVNKNSLIINSLNNKIHDFSYLKKKFFKKNSDKIFFKFVFSEYGYPNSWIDSLKINKEKTLVVHYPHSPFTTFYKKTQSAHYQLKGDLLLTNGKADVKKWSNFISKKKIKALGAPKYEMWWRKQILNVSKLDFNKKFFFQKKSFVVTIPYKSYFDVFPDKKNILKKQLFDLMDTLLSFPKIKIIFKTHPRINSDYAKEYLKKYQNYKHRWIFSKSHLYSLANISDLFLCHISTATIFDGIAFKIPVIQFWAALPNIDKVSKANSYFFKKKLSIKVKNKNELKRLIKNILLKRNKKNLLDQQKGFKSIYLLKKQIANQIISLLNFEYEKKFKKKL